MPSILVVDDVDKCRNLADLFGDPGYVVDAAEPAAPTIIAGPSAVPGRA
jgi:hypothetical protein